MSSAFVGVFRDVVCRCCGSGGAGRGLSGCLTWASAARRRVLTAGGEGEEWKSGVGWVAVDGGGKARMSEWCRLEWRRGVAPLRRVGTSSAM